MRKMGLFFLVAFISCSPEQKQGTSTGIKKPNILLIVADDLGFSDIEPFGGNIHTPVLNSLAKESFLFSNFHVLPTCSPTRAALLTGHDNHVAGFGIMSEMDYPALHRQQLPGYMAHLSNNVVTMPELFRANNYRTYMVGKWHLGEGPGKYPVDRGFDESFILGTGGGSHWNDKRALAPPQHMSYFRNEKEVELPHDFYSSRNYTDSLIQFIDRDKSDSRPFFAFLSYTAVHDPLHAPEEYIKKYEGKFDNGWDSLAVERLHNLTSLGIVHAGAKRKPNPNIPAWSALTHEQREEFARDMEVYAAMLDYMDVQIGRVFEYLKSSGLYDNTLIIFMSDNGANGAVSSTYPGNADGKYLSTFDNSQANRGLKGSYVEMGPGWAMASSVPFSFFKTFTTEGGIKAPLMVKIPELNGAGKWVSSLIHVTDIMPSLLELTGTTYPSEYNGNAIRQNVGKSILPVLKGEVTELHDKEGIGYELFEMKAYLKGNWKILRLPYPMGSGEWELYDLSKDPGETTDLSSVNPEIRSQLINDWNDYAKRNEVYDHNGHYDSLYRKSF